MRNFLIIRNKWLGLFILTFGCYITDSTASAELESQSLKNQEDINLISNKIDTINIDANSNIEKIDQLNKKLLSLQEQIGKNSVYIDGLKDSIRAFQQLDISSASADQDIINSLIRIQSKLNIIEDKIFYSDSLYFNLLNDLVLIEAQIEDLNQNIDNVTSLNVSIQEIQDEIDVGTNIPIDTVDDYKASYDLAYEFYANKEYEKSLKAFKILVDSDKEENLADNAQFWIGQIYYIQRNYKLAISEYKKVSTLGDMNKAPDADYKIALSYIGIGETDLALNQLNYIIEKYPNNLDLINKSIKLIEGNK
tara:strand:+ start:741 stop:1664 length:924 start_codon:yes stop_codon:yes gene_type:complete